MLKASQNLCGSISLVFLRKSKTEAQHLVIKSILNVQNKLRCTQRSTGTFVFYIDELRLFESLLCGRGSLDVLRARRRKVVHRNRSGIQPAPFSFANATAALCCSAAGMQMHSSHLLILTRFGYLVICLLWSCPPTPDQLLPLSVALHSLNSDL